MHSYIISYILFVFALISTTAMVSLSTTVDCKDSEDGTAIRSPIDCAIYYVCDDSQPIQMMCPAGLWYDTEHKICNFPEYVDCGAECVDPWVRPGSGVPCYLASSGEAMTYDAAEKYCNSMDSGLAEPRSVFETEQVQELLDEGYNYWIGLTDKETEGKFVWSSDLTEAEYSNWHKREPNNANGNQDCAHLWANHGYRWDDLRCGQEKLYGKKMTALCQK